MPRLLPEPAYFATLPKAITSGAVSLRDEHGHLVIEKPNYRDHWVLPGGRVDAAEDAPQCAPRDGAERLGLPGEGGRRLRVDWRPSSARGRVPMGVHFLFDAGVIPRAELEATVLPEAAELEDWALIPESEAHLLSPWGAARTLRALAVLRGEAQLDLVSWSR